MDSSANGTIFAHQKTLQADDLTKAETTSQATHQIEVSRKIDRKKLFEAQLKFLNPDENAEQ